MQFDRTNRFKRAYRRLSSTDKGRVDAAIRRFENNPLHPSLAVEKITGHGSVWSIRASLRVRCTFEWEGSIANLRNAERILLLDVGGHEVYRRN